MMARRPDTSKFQDSQEAAFRKMVRQSIKRAPITRAERDIVASLINFWFHHKSNGLGYIHPGREKLAKRARVTEKTVSRCLAMLRENGVLEVLSNAKGGWGKSTRYRVHIIPLLKLCGHRFLDEIEGHLEPVNVPHSHREMSHKLGVAMSHGYNSVANDIPSQGFGNVFPLRAGGAK